MSTSPSERWRRVPTLAAIVWFAVLLVHAARWVITGHVQRWFDVLLPLSLLGSLFVITKTTPFERQTTSTRFMTVLLIFVGIMTLGLRVWEWVDP